MGGFAQISSGRERWDPYVLIPRHCHDRAYAALVLAGSYEESGSRGRFRVGPGDVLLHDAFDAHLDRFCGRGAQILNLLVEGFSPGFGIGRIDDPDAIVRIAERDVAEASLQLRTRLRPIQHVHGDWQDKLADDLLHDPGCLLHQWARDNNLAAATVSRGFRKVFDLTPAEFRSEARARRALTMIATSPEPLAIIAVTAGFADQAHMSRAIRALTGAPPGYWHRSNRFKTVNAPAGQIRCHECCD
jgi:AraC-like DNA-binding protein